MKRCHHVATLVRGATASILTAYLFLGSCGGSRSGFVIAFKAGRVSIVASWCGPVEAGEDREATQRGDDVDTGS